MAKKIGTGTYLLEHAPSAAAYAAIVGQMEGEGPLGACFDYVEQDSYFGKDSWEQAESELQRRTVGTALQKAELTAQDIDLILAGDLINQCTGTTYGLRGMGIPLLGLYGACSTMAEGLALGSILMDSGIARHIVAATSSHFSTAERQFRFPLSYGGQRTPTAQWTCTASGAVVLAPCQNAPYLRAVTIGRIVDYGITDANNMGAAMAPAAIDTLIAHFNDTHRTPDYYDMILTGDLGVIGSDILVELMLKEGFDIRTKHKDCGKMIFDIEEQDVHAGGSGCGCCGSVFCGYVYRELKRHNLSKVLVMATGALMNPMIIEQGESIPAIAHAVAIEI